MKNYNLADSYSTKLLTTLESIILAKGTNTIDLNLIKKAMFCAKKYHGLQARHSGEPFYSHTFEVAAMIAGYYFETDAIIASILHDIVEDTAFDINQVGFVFNPNIQNIVDSLTKLESTSKRRLSPEWVLNKLGQDKIATTIKLLDRTHNMQTIDYIKNPTKRIRIATETIKIYVPLAQAMGLQSIKDTLLRLSYNVLNSSTSS